MKRLIGVSRFLLLSIFLYSTQGLTQSGIDQVVRLAEKNKTRQALRLLDRMENNRSVNEDLALMTRGRIYFQIGQLDNAYQAYDKVPKSSSYWLESMEEKAHVMGRKEDYAKTLAILQSVLTPTFQSLVGPEPYFVAALTNLKICNYTEVFKVSEQFKSRFRSRIKALEELSPSGESDATTELAMRLQSRELNQSTIGHLAEKLPRRLVRDRYVKANPKRLNNRVMQLAREELREIEDIVNKLHIVEAEIIHRIHVATGLASERSKQGLIRKDSNVLVFPMSREVWIDEIDTYQAQIEKCGQSNGSAAL